MMVNSKIINDMLIDLNLIHLSVSLVTLPFLILTIIFLFDSEFYFGICAESYNYLEFNDSIFK